MRSPHAEVPAAYLVTDGRPRRPVRLRVLEWLAPLQDASRTVLALLIGLWPLWAAFMLGVALIWGTAMADSP